MKKVIFMIVILASFNLSFANEKCPFDQVNCTGQCGRYSDENNDRYCDHGELTLIDEDFGNIKNEYLSLEIDDKTANIQSEINANNVHNLNITIKPSKAERYKFWEISIFIITIYLSSFLLQKTKKVSFKIHRAIWNILLLISFLVSGILGMFLALGIIFNLPFSMLDMHVKTGIFMFWITLFHVIERWRFFAHLFCKKK